MSVVYNKSVLFRIEEFSTRTHVLHEASNLLSLEKDDIYLQQNGKRLGTEEIDNTKDVKIILRLKGGKGGFGSMLRAIGAQIEKTTNREACRDLSGRRLRDINEEQRLKEWLANKGEREKEAAARKKKKLERMCEEPKHEFKDDAYFKELSELPKRVEDAVLQGLEASCSTKRQAENDDKRKKKKRKLWLDEDLEDLSSSDEDGSHSEQEDEVNQKTETTTVAHDVDEKQCGAEAVTV